METGKTRPGWGAIALIPSWLITADISARAFRLYGVLALGGELPSRKEMAGLLRCSTHTIDRALRELEVIGAVISEPNIAGDGGLLPSYRHVVLVDPSD